MIIGAHSIVSSSNPEADREFFRDILSLPNVDVGDGWLIFGLPPSEVAVHPADKNDSHELYLMCENVEAFISDMQARDVSVSDVHDEGWGLLTRVTLPGGGTIGVYEPRHARPDAPTNGHSEAEPEPAAPVKKRARKASKKKVSKSNPKALPKAKAGKPAKTKGKAKAKAKKRR
ncbi:MAG TPA: hypothetical protein VJV78_34445 [Polyangiales bacterium]|nr:hypothetical protein [Polyangiales bacterium]